MNKIIGLLGILLVVGFGIYQYQSRNPAATPVTTIVPAVQDAPAAQVTDPAPETAEAAPVTTASLTVNVGEFSAEESATVSVVSGRVTVPATLSAAWEKDVAARMVAKETLKAAGTQTFPDLGAGDYTVLLIVMDGTKRTPPETWRITAHPVSLTIGDETSLSL